jgi:hypothetical protein
VQWHEASVARNLLRDATNYLKQQEFELRLAVAKAAKRTHH